MATKKAPAKKAAAPTKAVATKAAAAPAAPKTSKVSAVAASAAPVKKLSKTEVYRSIGEKLGVPAKQVGTFFDTMVETAIDQTKSAGEFTIPGLGKLVKVERKERQGRNPATGQTITIAAKTDVKFRLGKSLKDSIAPKQ